MDAFDLLKIYNGKSITPNGEFFGIYARSSKQQIDINDVAALVASNYDFNEPGAVGDSDNCACSAC